MSRPALMEAAPPARGHSPSLASLASSPLSSPLHPCCFLENGAPIWSLCCRPTFTEEDCRCRWSNFWFCGWSIASFLHEFGVLLSPCVLHISAFPSRYSWYEIRFLKNNGMLICCGQRWCIKVQGELMLAPCCRYTSLLTSPKISFSWSRQLYMMKPLILEFVQVLSRSHLKMRVWERGAGATLACGTGACAVVVAVVLEGRAERI